jgi:hypothetical protein
MAPRDRTTFSSGWACFHGLFLATALLSAASLSAEVPPTVLLSDVLRSQNAQLATVDSNDGAVALFATSVGPSVGLRDAAGTLRAKGLPPKLVQELGVEDLSRSAQRLVSALSAWQFAEAVGQTARASSPAEEAALPASSPARGEWLTANSRIPSLPALFQQVSANGQAGAPVPASRQELALAAAQTAFEANQQAIAAWWELYGWKDRVRLARGRARLCGTWQWVIHNHQRHHQEQKLSLIFPPPGSNDPPASGLVETVVLGENVYLRWEINGQIQEDSLQFSKEGQRLEGTFVNSQGGWGSITGKRTADCRP